MFTIQDYQSNIVSLIERGFINKTFDDKFHKDEKCFILRHDVDLSVDAALKMAKAEYEIGVIGHYFFLVTSPLYNILSRDIAEKINEISLMGHQIGLHYDPSALFDFYQQESIFKLYHAVPYFSIHKFSMIKDDDKWVLGLNKCVDDINFELTGFMYFADSWGIWANGNPWEINEKMKKVIINCHPEWYIWPLKSSPLYLLNKHYKLYLDYVNENLMGVSRPEAK